MLAGAGVFYHFAIYLPGFDSDRKAAEVAATAVQEKKERSKLIAYEACLEAAREGCDADWATACKSVAAKQRRSRKRIRGWK